MGQMFPVRLLGFGLYWGWLFLTCVSPSTVFGAVTCFGQPFELFELLFRLAFVLAIYALYKKVETRNGRNALMTIGGIGGPFATVLLHYGGYAGAIDVVTILMALVDAVLFILWLCFFGHMRVGETALYMALSYCVG